MVNYGRISMESKKGSRFDISTDTEPQLIFVPSKGNILVFNLSKCVILSKIKQKSSNNSHAGLRINHRVETGNSSWSL
jgi:hypothetical protein